MMENSQLRTNREVWERLPSLVTVSTVVTVTGLSRWMVDRLRKEGKLRVWRSRAGGYAKFYKTEVLGLMNHEQERRS